LGEQYFTIKGEALTIEAALWKIMTMKRLVILCLPLLLFACNGYEKENSRLKDEVRLLREENNYLKAQIIGMKKEMEDLYARQNEVGEAPPKPAGEGRSEAQKAVKKEQAQNGTAKKDQAQPASVKKDQPQNGTARNEKPDKAKPKKEAQPPSKKEQPSE
jgi:hypothetical protein